tara:strand:+ start:500 stop:904 length:405 start_codon:yes stop_codon:yes gene_type:complete
MVDNLSKRNFDHIQRNFKAGEVIYEIGERSELLYLIHSGTVSIRTRHGLEVGVLNDGEIFGEVGRVIGSPRTVTAKAKTNCTVYEIDWSKLQEKLDGADAVLVAIIRGLSLRIGDANELSEKFWRELSLYKSLE